MGTQSADPGGLAKADTNHEISLPQFIRSPPTPSVWKSLMSLKDTF